MTQDNRAGVIRRGKARASVDPRLRLRPFLKPVPTDSALPVASAPSSHVIL